MRFLAILGGTATTLRDHRVWISEDVQTQHKYVELLHELYPVMPIDCSRKECVSDRSIS